MVFKKLDLVIKKIFFVKKTLKFALFEIMIILDDVIIQNNALHSLINRKQKSTKKFGSEDFLHKNT